MLWNEFLTLLIQRAPGIERGLRPPPSAEAITALESVLSQSLPQEVKDILRVHDSQTLGGRILFGLVLMRLDAIQKYLLTYQPDPFGFVDEEDLRLQQPQTRPFLPVFTDDTGNYLGVDLNPGPQGLLGQVVVFGADLEEPQIIAPSLSRFLADLALEVDHATVQEEDGLPTLRLTAPEKTGLAELLPS